MLNCVGFIALAQRRDPPRSIYFLIRAGPFWSVTVTKGRDSPLWEGRAQNGNCGRMAFVFDFDPTHQILRSKFSGRVSDEDLLNHQRAALLLVMSLDPRSAILDLSAADLSYATSRGMRKLAKLPAAMPKMDRPSVLIAPSDHTFGMARIFQLEGEATHPNLHVVRSEREAWAILGVEMERAKFGPISEAPFAPGS